MPRCQHHQLQCHGRIGLPPLGPNFPGVCVGTLECGYALQMQIGDMAEASVRGGDGSATAPPPRATCMSWSMQDSQQCTFDTYGVMWECVESVAMPEYVLWVQLHGCPMGRAGGRGSPMGPMQLCLCFGYSEPQIASQHSCAYIRQDVMRSVQCCTGGSRGSAHCSGGWRERWRHPSASGGRGLCAAPSCVYHP